VSTLAMGCSRLGAFWQRRSPREGLAALRAAVAAGINLFDTADCYARGISERLLGRALAPHRDDVVVCTKVGLVKTPRAVAAAIRAQRGGARSGIGAVTRRTEHAEGGASCYEPRYLRGAAERSLRRLRRERLDLLLLHGPPLEVVRRGEALGELAALVDDGLVGHFGVCTLDEDVALAALDVARLGCLEVPYDLCRREFASRVIPLARERGIGVLALAPLGDGRLLGEVDGLAPDEVVAACLRAAVDVPGVASTIVGMARPEHVARNALAMHASLPTDAGARVRAARCGSGPT
jgi:aryl-alcohol dehydrogenase-like predicted oxidoreductase